VSVRIQNNVAYGLSQPLIDTPLLPIVSNRAPGFNDKAPIGTIWVDKSQNTAYLLTSIVNNEATWVNITQDTADFTTVTTQTNDGVATVISAELMPDDSSINISGFWMGTRDDFAESLGGDFSAVFLKDGANPSVVVDNPFIGTAATNGVGNARFTVDVGPNAALLVVTGNGGQVWNWKVVYTTVILP